MAGLRGSVVRIRDGRDQVIGAGFLVGPRHVLSCAHVVASALGVPDTGDDPPDGTVVLDFPLSTDGGSRLTARVVHWQPVRPDGRGDIAGLLLDTGPPEDAEPATLIELANPWGHDFRTFGFPAGRPAGDWASGVLADVQATGWLQIEHERQTGRRVQPGFSGAPVWVDSLQGVVGMVVAADRQVADRVAYVIPTAVLVAGWAQLGRDQAAAANPYRGLSAFQTTDADVFFGRDDVVGRLVEAVAVRPLTAVVGPSGSGKSSLVQAGLVAHLGATRQWTVLTIRPRKEPFEELAAALLGRLEPDSRELDLLENIPKLARLLHEGRSKSVIRRVLDARQNALLLVVDQFEELYTHQRDPGRQAQFVHQLLEVARAFRDEPGVQVRVVLVMRADFLGQALGDREFAEMLTGAIEPIGPMAPHQLRAAIEEPAKLRHHRFERGLVDRILRDVGNEPGKLPLLEFTLTRLWDSRSGGWINHADYEAFGGVEGALTDYAEREYERCSPVERDQVRRVLLQLVSPGEGTGDTRRLAIRGDLADGHWPIVQRLADRRLVVTAGGLGDEQTVEVVHEALIHGWTRLRDWIAAYRDFRQWQERVRNAIRVWREHDEDEGALLRGSLLAEAETWLRDQGADVGAEERAFVCRSRDRQEHEDAQYKRLYQEALSRQLVAQAELARGHRPNLIPLTVLLSIEALRRATSFEADYALRRGMALLPVTAVRLRHAKDVQAVAFSPDGRTVATASDDTTIRLWDARTGHELVCLSGHIGLVRSVLFSPRGDIVATGGEDEVARLWSVHDGTELAVLPHRGWVGALAFNADGTLLATGCDDGIARVWRGSTEPVAQLEHSGWVRSVAFQPAGSLLLTASGDHSVRLWQVDAWSEQSRTMCDAPVRTAVFAPDGSRVASGCEDGAVHVWNPHTAEMTRLLHQGPVPAVAFSHDGGLLATGAEDGLARLWNLRTGGELLRLPHAGPVRAVAFDAGDTRLATASDDGTGRLWSVPDGIELVRACHSRPVRAIALSPDGACAVTGSEDGDGTLWSATARAETVRWNQGAAITAIAFSPDGALVAVAADDGTVRIWETTDGAKRHELTGSPSPRALSFSPDGEVVAVATDDGAIQLWDTAQGTLRRQLDDSGAALAFSADSRRLAAASDDGSATVWQLDDGAMQSRRSYGQQWLATVALAPGFSRIAAVASQGHVQVMDVATASLQAEFSHESWIAAAVFSEDGRLVATGAEDGSARVWDAATGAERSRLTHDRPVTAIAFSPDTAHLATGTAGGQVRLWPLRHGDLIEQACSRLTRNLTVEEWRRYLGDAPYEKTCADLPG